MERYHMHSTPSWGGCLQELHTGVVTEPLLRRSRTELSLPSKEDSLLDAEEDQRLLAQQQAQLASTLEEVAASDEESPALALWQRVRSVRSARSDPRSADGLDTSPFAEISSDTFTPWPPPQSVQRPEGPRLELRHQPESLSRDWVLRHAERQGMSNGHSGGGPAASVLQDCALPALPFC